MLSTDVLMFLMFFELNLRAMSEESNRGSDVNAMVALLLYGL
jgi:hypothetical protein